jgi:hypothetical protein
MLMAFHDLVPILQVAIGPVILISGVGLLLLSMTNRYGRIIDRTRILVEALRRVVPEERGRLAAQLKVLALRARLVRMAITLAGTSVLLAAVLIIGIFFAVLFDLELAILIALIFIASMAALIGSLVYFMRDINLSLEALNLEVSEDGRPN